MTDAYQSSGVTRKMYTPSGVRSLTRRMSQKIDVHLLDEAINEASDPAESQCELLREHLEASRQYALGAMQEEYKVTLALARQAMNCIANPDRKKRVHNLLDRLTSEERG
jgi:hypothetical protein